MNRGLITLLFSMCLCGCSSTFQYNDALYDRIKNRGMIPLSTDNPFLAANLLVSKEAERSPVFKGFIQHRGAPPVIRVEKTLFSPALLQFYYPHNKEFYTLDADGDSWIIGGPYPIDREHMVALSAIVKTKYGQPALSTPIAVEASAQQATTKQEIAPSFSATSSPPEEIIRKPFQSPVVAKKREPLPFSELIARYGTHPAELTPKGDLVHYVSYQGETVEMLARWYTLDETNGDRIARINGLPKSKLISTGDSIVIPRYLVKNKFRLTEEVVTALQIK